MSSFHFQIIALKNSLSEFVPCMSQFWPVFRSMTHIFIYSFTQFAECCLVRNVTYLSVRQSLVLTAVPVQSIDPPACTKWNLFWTAQTSVLPCSLALLPCTVIPHSHQEQLLSIVLNICIVPLSTFTVNLYIYFLQQWLNQCFFLQWEAWLWVSLSHLIVYLC